MAPGPQEQELFQSMKTGLWKTAPKSVKLGVPVRFIFQCRDSDCAGWTNLRLHTLTHTLTQR